MQLYRRSPLSIGCSNSHPPFAVGRPIHVTQNDNPSTEQLEVVQKEYIEELMRCVSVDAAV